MYAYHIQIYRDPSKDKEYRIDHHDIILGNKDFIVLDDWRFTKIAKGTTYSADAQIGRPTIFEMNLGLKGKYDSLVYKCYSEKQKTAASIRKEIIKYLENKYGWLTSIDLSFLGGDK